MIFEFPETVTDLKIVPDDFQGMYIQAEEGGDYTLPKALGPSANAFKSLQATLAKVRKESDTFRNNQVDLSLLAEYGDNPEEIASSFSVKLEEMQTKDVKTKDAIAKVKEDIMKAAAGDLEKSQNRADAYKAQLHKVLVTNEAHKVLITEKGAIDLLLPHVERLARITDQDGKFVTEVIDQDGDTRYSPTTAERMTIAELVKEMKAKPEFARAFDSDTPSGGGANPNAGSRQNMPKPKKDMSANDKIGEGLKNRGIGT